MASTSLLSETVVDLRDFAGTGEAVGNRAQHTELCEHLVQSLFLHCLNVAGQEATMQLTSDDQAPPGPSAAAGGAGGGEAAAADPFSATLHGLRRTGLLTGGSETASSGLAATMREARRSDLLRHMDAETRELLLAGTLYEYHSNGMSLPPARPPRSMAMTWALGDAGLGARHNSRSVGLTQTMPVPAETVFAPMAGLARNSEAPQAYSGTVDLLFGQLDGVRLDDGWDQHEGSIPESAVEVYGFDDSLPNNTDGLREIASASLGADFESGGPSPRNALRTLGRLGDLGATTSVRGGPDGSGLGESFSGQSASANAGAASLGGTASAGDSWELEEDEFDLEPEGGLDGGLVALLRHLSSSEDVDQGSLDDALVHSMRRLLQLTHALAGVGLSEEEVEALPKVRFDRAEEQLCAICLEDFREGEVLAALRCNHAFHVSCVTRWFRESTQCPLCRSQCRGPS